MSGVIRWEEPPSTAAAGRRRATAWKVVADELRSRPGCWALVYVGGAEGVQTRIQNGIGGWAPAGAFEAVTRGRRPQSVYARYIGETPP